MTKSYAERARQYAHRVATGQEVAGLYERLMCQRFLSDLERQGADGWPYVFDERAGSRACRFLELLPHIKGEWARPVYVDGKLGYAKLVLEDWQIFIEIQLFGWVHRETRLRRFRRSYEEIARKNAKSTRVAGRQLYLLTADGEPGAHCYSAATTGEQAREVFDVARNMALREPEFLARFGVNVGKHDITVADTASSFKPLNAEGSTLDGLNVHGGAVDEVHAHKKRDLWDVLDTATGARSQPLLSAITTAGSDLGGICYELRGYTIKVLEGTVADDTWFGAIYTIDDGDVWHDSRIWRKANPNLGISVKVDDMEAACRKAMAMPSSLGNFMTKRLNVWTNAGTAWMDMIKWRACADHAVRIEDFKGEKCWAGLDLAQKSDFAAYCRTFQRDGLWYVFVNLYLNEDAVDASDNAQLKGWAIEGYVKTTPGNVTDFDVIAQDMRNDCAQFDMQEIAYDPALSMYFAGKLVEEGLPMVEIAQRSTFFTPPLLQVENLVLENKLRYAHNPVLTWMVSNLVVKVSKFNELRSPTKDRPENKIDGPMAMLMALGRALAGESGNIEQGFVVLEPMA